MRHRRDGIRPSTLAGSVAIALALLMPGCARPAVEDAADSTSTEQTGTVTFQFETEPEIGSLEVDDVPAGTMLEDVMRRIEAVPIKIKGSGTTAFVDAIGDQATGSGQGWTFEVDGEFANQGIGRTPLNPPTTVTWSFGEFSSEDE